MNDKPKYFSEIIKFCKNKNLEYVYVDRGKPGLLKKYLEWDYGHVSPRHRLIVTLYHWWIVFMEGDKYYSSKAGPNSFEAEWAYSPGLGNFLEVGSQYPNYQGYKNDFIMGSVMSSIGEVDSFLLSKLIKNNEHFWRR